MSLEREFREALSRADSEEPVGTAVKALFREAVAARASDIHLNPSEEGLTILFRLDGVLQSVARVDPERAKQFVGKIKVLSGLLTYRTDIAQDGHVPSVDAGGAGDARVSVFPTIDGERAVIRLFTDTAGIRSVTELGFPSTITDRLMEKAARSEGVILLTGPSGSGKTTTIYALIEDALRRHEGHRHIVTIEDPVERRIKGITQTQVNAATGMTFARSLRSLLRHDPNVILVGEIRDRETAQVAMEAGLTGHLVISTIHAGTAVGVILRLREMGVEPHVLTASLACILAQRLARRICAECRQSGCEACRQTGFNGRSVFGELLVVTDALRAAVSGEADRAALQVLAEREGLIHLREAGEALVHDGVTTAEELARLTG